MKIGNCSGNGVECFLIKQPTFLSLFSDTLDHGLDEFLAVFNIYMKHNKELDSGCQAGYTPGGRHHH